MPGGVSQQGGMGSVNQQEITVFNAGDIVRSPSIVVQLVRALCEADSLQEGAGFSVDDDFEVYEIDLKLSHNKVKQYYDFITHYGEYVGFVENGYEAIQPAKPNSRMQILRAINLNYRESVGGLIKAMGVDPTDVDAKVQLIQEYSDDLIESSIEYVKNICLASSNAKDIAVEDIHSHCRFIVFHAFVECKVLEKPA